MWMLHRIASIYEAGHASYQKKPSHQPLRYTANKLDNIIVNIIIIGIFNNYFLTVELKYLLDFIPINMKIIIKSLKKS